MNELKEEVTEILKQLEEIEGWLEDLAEHDKNLMKFVNKIFYVRTELEQYLNL